MPESESPDSPGAAAGAEALSRRLRSADRWGALLIEAPKWAALAVVVWQLGVGIEVLSGRTGLASLVHRFGRETTVWELVCWAAAVAGILLGLHSRYVLRRLRDGAAARR
jgi:hypothetical protein